MICKTLGGDFLRMAVDVALNYHRQYNARDKQHPVTV